MEQIAALPYRAVGGACEVLLVTSRSTRRWVLPKGNPIPGLSPHAAAAQEAYEEAGIEGSIGTTALGSYRYAKQRDGAEVAMEVTVYPLAVARELPDWPERSQRERRWFALPEAAGAVNEPDLGTLIESFGMLVPGDGVEPPTP